MLTIFFTKPVLLSDLKILRWYDKGKAEGFSSKKDAMYHLDAWDNLGIATSDEAWPGEIPKDDNNISISEGLSLFDKTNSNAESCWGCNLGEDCVIRYPDIHGGFWLILL